MTFDELMEDLKKDPKCRDTIEKAEIISDFIVENDYVQVVRCKDCLHFHPMLCGNGYYWRGDGGSCIKDNRQWAVSDDFFCYDGERNDGWDYEGEQI